MAGRDELSVDSEDAPAAFKSDVWKHFGLAVSTNAKGEKSPHSNTWKDPALSKVNRFCRESRCMDQWVPIINLPDR